MNVCYDRVEYSLPLLVVSGKGPALQLLGRNWLEKMELNWPIIICCNMLDDVGSNLKTVNFFLQRFGCCTMLYSFGCVHATPFSLVYNSLEILKLAKADNKIRKLRGVIGFFGFGVHFGLRIFRS